MPRGFQGKNRSLEKLEQMKILFINRSDGGGGAANAAWRLSENLHKKYGTKNYFIVEIKRRNKGNTKETRCGILEKLAERFINKIFNTLGLQYVFLPFSSRNIIRQAKMIKPDVISIHNIHGGYFQISLLPKLSNIAPIVWTFNDMWPVTRNAAHTFGNNAWKKMKSFKGENLIYPPIGLNSGSLLLKRKLEIYKKTKMVIVAISKWVERFSKESPLLKGKQIFQIYHGIDLKSFKPGNKELSRKTLKIPATDKVIMFGASFLQNNPWKGGKLLMEILDEIDKKTETDISLLIVGKGGNKLFKNYKRLNVFYLGYVSDQLMPICYQSADCFINPTKADSLSLVLVEATACGTPCVTYDIGGTREIISDAVNGYLIKPFEKKKFADAVLKILNNNGLAKGMSKSGIRIAESEFSSEEMTKKYYSLFKNVKKYIE